MPRPPAPQRSRTGVGPVEVAVGVAAAGVICGLAIADYAHDGHLSDSLLGALVVLVLIGFGRYGDAKAKAQEALDRFDPPPTLDSTEDPDE